jgi:hypothetical protein
MGEPEYWRHRIAPSDLLDFDTTRVHARYHSRHWNSALSRNFALNRHLARPGLKRGPYVRMAPTGAIGGRHRLAHSG